MTAALTVADIVPVLQTLADADELVDVGDIADLAARAVMVHGLVAARDDVRAVYAGGERLHEVRFTMRHEGVVLRGTIDCLVRRPDGSLTVLEFKTGRPRPEHQEQVDLYRRAAERIFPGVRIDSLLVYPQQTLEL